MVVLPALRALRNGIEVGTKMRAAHCLVIILLYRRKAPLSKNVKFLVESIVEHAGHLGAFAFLYKLCKGTLDKHLGVPPHLSSFVAGSVAGYLIWGRNRSSLKYQIVLYLLSRNIAAISTKLSEKGFLPSDRYAQIASLTWGIVMAIHSGMPESMQEGLRSSMDFLYNDDNYWVPAGKSRITDFVPFC